MAVYAGLLPVLLGTEQLGKQEGKWVSGWGVPPHLQAPMDHTQTSLPPKSFCTRKVNGRGLGEV